MPIFDFSCNDCSEEFEFFKIRTSDIPSCPSCSSTQLTRRVSTFAVGNSTREIPPPKSEKPKDSGHVCTSACNHGSAKGQHTGCGVSIADSLRKKYGYD